MKKIVYILAVAALAFAACDKQLPVNEVSGDLTEIAFSLKAETRAPSEVTTSNLNSINVTATKGSGETQVFSNVAFTKANGWKAGKYWPSTDENYHFYASNASMTYSSSGTTITANTADNLDIVADYVASPTWKQTMSLQMDHVFAQVGTVKLLLPEGCWVENLKVWVTPVTSGTLNLKTGAWSNKTNGSVVYLVGTSSTGVSISTEGGSYTSADNNLWLVPGTYSLSVSYTIHKGDYQVTFSGSSAKTAAGLVFAAGFNNNIIPTKLNGVEIPNIPEPDGAQEITFSVTVTPWDNQDVQASFQ